MYGKTYYVVDHRVSFLYRYCSSIKNFGRAGTGANRDIFPAPFTNFMDAMLFGLIT